MSSSKNNFKKDDVKEKSKYKLWVLYKPEFAKKFKSNPFTYFSYNTKSDGGLSALINLAEKRQNMYLLAVLYDNQSADKDNNEIKRWERGAAEKKKYESDQAVGFIKRKRPRIVMPTIKRVW